MNKAFLITLILPKSDLKSINEEILEMTLLANALNYEIIDTVHQKRSSIDSSTYFGKGKIKELINKSKLLNIDTIFINDEINPSYYKNIMKLCKEKIKIIDRTKLILDIFHLHAKTNESKKQIELATFEYMLPRIVGQWTHLERQMGGVGTTGGPGEKQIEIDRRLIRKSIEKLKKELNTIQTQHNNQIKNRENIFKIALAGYTNSGKSTLLKKITGYDAYIKDQLFATLETVTKKLKLPSNTNVLISDTVGFLRKLPHNLIASFRSTLSEIIEADLIIKVIDINSTDIEGHLNTINETLDYLKIADKNFLLVFNKIDMVENDQLFNIVNKKYNNPIMISAINDLNLDDLIEKIDEEVLKNTTQYKLKIPHASFSIIKYIYNNTSIIKRTDDFDFIKFNFRCSKEVFELIKSKL